MKRITILIPAYNESEVIEQMHEVLSQTCSKLSRYQFEFLFVNDGSSDNTIDLIKILAEKDERVQYVDLSRNFGKEIAMSAGFDYAKGDAVVIIDADLQQPPETIEEMIYWWEQGYDDVYATREERKGESGLKKLTSKLYYKMLQKVTKERIYPNAGDFRLLDRKCIDALKQLREQARYTKGMYAWIGFKKKEISYVAEPRAGGETKWKLSSLWLLAIDGITAYSTLPLKVWSIIGTIISLLGFVYLLIEIGKTLIYGSDVAGYPSMLAGILLLGGIQLISLGVIGEYLGRVFVETKGRPLYFVQESSKEKKLSVEKEQKTDTESVGK
ncbi:glycosyltransferase family 2 protein [Pisciglobus halotolerans]|uniref:Glycosyltransferase involved in cell wall bisynthesis n=1 Tax=Pisciglobus halotolerans TaxID=745365 RepID=A0A1I3CTV6_9LACT|nr:glycosyltransferase family 2 protein [Pisciglobus halotolerans]SFH77935.1 Glycosyltransferase involved in cell wall bisynthesis [Pisciglobus halotolerans]